MMDSDRSDASQQEQDLLLKARMLRGEGRGSDALALLMEARREHPRNVMVAEAYFGCLLYVAPPLMTLREVDAYLKDHGDEGFAVGIKVSALLSLGRPGSALEVIEHFSAANGFSSMLAKEKVYALVALGRLQEARELYSSSGLDRANSTEALRLGLQVEPPKNRDELEARLDNYRSAGAGAHAVVEERLIWMEAHSPREEALAAARQALEGGLRDSRIEQLYARALILVERFDEAEQFLKAVLERDPGQSWAFTLLARLLVRRRRYGKVVRLGLGVAWRSSKNTSFFGRPPG